ncbi:glutaredoxin-related protein [Prevotella sp. PINT]|jgi:Glutaredoxin-related protein|uniref:glutaredoxin domain-containing protein n=1 Tax=Palleniella intestinalis TaxID=2736291 RepID=UPI001552225C|nr:glutaredoxin domain-containing protein [Palleniella intestinalis]NPD82685.1 glutaredoxin-related protein [Palleniella intestinalis]
MIKIYVMSTCPDCTAVKKQAEGNSRYEIIDIGSHVRRLKEFMRLRDTREEFAPMRRLGYVGIPCFILEDGTITFRAEEAGFAHEEEEEPQGAACNLDGSGC